MKNSEITTVWSANDVVVDQGEEKSSQTERSPFRKRARETKDQTRPSRPVERNTTDCHAAMNWKIAETHWIAGSTIRQFHSLDFFRELLPLCLSAERARNFRGVPLIGRHSIKPEGTSHTVADESGVFYTVDTFSNRRCG